MLDDDVAAFIEGQLTPDLLALYQRETDQTWQVRLDFFDLDDIADFDLYLGFGVPRDKVKPSGVSPQDASWEVLLRVAASGQIDVQDAQGNAISQARIQVFRNPTLDHLTLSISKQALPVGRPGLRVFAWLTSPESEHLLDALPMADSQSRSPKPVDLLLAFSDSFPAYTPAQALRRWDGAHTGPNGGRHGLSNLLRISQNHKIPVALLDLLNPASLSALDYMDRSDAIHMLTANQQVIAPQYAPDIGSVAGRIADLQVSANLQQLNHHLVSSFQTRQPLLIYAPSGFIPDDRRSRVVFLKQNPTELPGLEVRPFSWKNKIVIPVTSFEAVPQATLNGPSQELKQTLVNAMLKPAARIAGQPSQPLIVLGGSLPNSAWGDPAAARPTLRYLASRPWLRFLNENDLLRLKAPARAEKWPSFVPPEEIDQELLKLYSAIQNAPQNELSQAANQAFLAAANPIFPHPDDLSLLRRLYLRQTWVLLSAAEWGQTPSFHANCDQDLDRDGAPECIFSNHKLYAVFNPQGGALSHLFFRTAKNGVQRPGLHQIIGPSTQVISGQRDPDRWDWAAGLHVDPAAILGAFDQSEIKTTPQLQSDGLLFTGTDGSLKIYRFSQNSLYVTTVRTSDRLVQKPQSLALMPDPWLRFTPGWWEKYHLTGGLMQWQVGWSPEVEIEIRSSLPIQARSFLDSQPWMGAVENPNREQPPGFFLPFPMIVFDFPVANQFDVEMLFQNIDP